MRTHDKLYVSQNNIYIIQYGSVHASTNAYTHISIFIMSLLALAGAPRHDQGSGGSGRRAWAWRWTLMSSSSWRILGEADVNRGTHPFLSCVEGEGEERWNVEVQKDHLYCRRMKWNGEVQEDQSLLNFTAEGWSEHVEVEEDHLYILKKDEEGMQQQQNHCCWGKGPGCTCQRGQWIPQ